MSFSETDLISLSVGLVIIALVLSDVFQSIIVPHYRPQGSRLSPLFISKLLWQPLRGHLIRRSRHTEQDLSLFAPAAIVSMLTFWLALLTSGYAMILWAERSSVKPPLNNFGEALYFAATSVLTVGYGDVIACSPVSRVTVIAAALSGLVLLAITVAFMFAVQSHFHNREVSAQIISSRHGHSKNGCVLYMRLLRDENAMSTLELCEHWLTDIYQSHSAYPILLYFRSRSSRASWLIQLLVVLDAAACAMAMQKSEYASVFASIYENGVRAVDVFCQYLSLSRAADDLIQAPETFVPIFENLGATNAQAAALRFAGYRQRYFAGVAALSRFFLIEMPVFNYADVLESRQLRYAAASPGNTVTFDGLLKP